MRTALAATLIVVAGLSAVAVAAPSRPMPAVEALAGDVIYVTTDGTQLHPDPNTPAGTALRNFAGTLLGVTWGQWQAVSASTRVRCRRDGTTRVRVALAGLIPGGVYSLFFQTFGPDSVNPFCPNAERSLVVPSCQGRGCVPIFDSHVIADAKGRARSMGRIPAPCLLDATQALLDVVYRRP